MTNLPSSHPSVQFTPLAQEGARQEGRASLKPAGKAAQLSWRSLLLLMLLALATAHIPQPAAAQTCTAPPNCKAQGKALTWNGTAWECIEAQANCTVQAAPVNAVCGGALHTCAVGYVVFMSGYCNNTWSTSYTNTWQCIGHYGGSVANCSLVGDNPACGE